MYVNRNRDKGWFITVFGPKIADECYKFYKHIQSWTYKPMESETFSICMVMGFLVCPMMQTSVAKVKKFKINKYYNYKTFVTKYIFILLFHLNLNELFEISNS